MKKNALGVNFESYATRIPLLSDHKNLSKVNPEK